MVLAQAITDMASASLTIITAHLPSHAYVGPPDVSSGAAFRTVCSRAALASAPASSSFDLLPTGNMVTGLPAGLLTCAQVLACV